MQYIPKENQVAFGGNGTNIFEGGRQCVEGRENEFFKINNFGGTVVNFHKINPVIFWVRQYFVYHDIVGCDG